MAEALVIDKGRQGRLRRLQKWTASLWNGPLIRNVIEAAPGFLLFFADVMSIPSCLSAAYLITLAAADKDMKPSLAGSAAAFLLRLIWGLPPRWEMLVTFALTLLAPMAVCGRGTSAMMLFTAAVTLPTVIAGFAGGTASALILSFAALPLCALSAPVMYRAVKALQGTRHIDSMEERVAVGYFAALMLCGGARIWIGVDIGVFLGAVLTLLMAMYLGPGVSCMTGMLAGIALSLQGLPLVLAVALSLGGFLAGMAHALGRRWITCIGFGLGSALTLILAGGTAHMGAFLLGSAVTAMLPRASIERTQLFFRRFLTAQPAPGDAYASCALAAWEKIVEAMALAVPSPADASDVHTSAWWEQKLCEGCPELDRCGCMRSELGVLKAETVWACRRSAQEVWQGALEQLRGLGCQRLYHLRQSMEYLRMEDAAAQRVIQHASEQRDMLVTHLTAMAGAARRFARLSSGECWWDDMSARRIRRRLAELAAPVRLSYVRRVQGHVQAAFELDYITGAYQQAEELCRVTADTLGVPMAVSGVDTDRVQLAECPLFTVEAGVASERIADGTQAPCGDTAWLGLLQDGRYLAALSDGMGHGDQAALASQQTVELLRLCLDAGYTRAQTLTAVNGMMLLAGQGERFSTVDLLTIDLWTGHAAIDKLGAACSWLIQGEKLTQLTGDALPIGILENIESRAEPLRLSDGDVLLLMTDGVEEAFSSVIDLEAAIRRALEAETPQEAAASLLASAGQAQNDLRPDDQTAVFLVIRRIRESPHRKDEAP